MAKSSKAKTPIYTPAPEALAQAKSKRITALALWAVAIILEVVAIVWLLRPRSTNWSRTKASHNSGGGH